jgi:hypothetical protein
MMNGRFEPPTPEQQVQAAAEQAQARAIITQTHPVHPAVTSIKVCALNYLAAASVETCPIAKARLLGIAEGIATVKAELAGPVSGIREHAVLREVFSQVHDIIPTLVALIRKS